MRTTVLLLVGALLGESTFDIARPNPAAALDIHGEVAGTFSSPVPTCPPATCTGIGTGAVTWGTPLSSATTPSSLAFRGRSFFTDLDVAQFKANGIAGDVDFTNGMIVTDTGITSLLLTLDVMYFDGSSDHVSRPVSIINTPNTTDPIASADAVRIQQGPDFFVLEDKSASATLIITFTLAPGSGFATLAAEPTLAELLDVDIQGFGTVTQGEGFLVAVPGPSTLTLVALAAVTLFRVRGGARRRRPWHRLLGRPVSESGSLRHGDGSREGCDRAAGG